MKTLIIALLSICLMPASGQAGDIVTRSFSEDVPPGEKVLSNVEHKALIAEFLDPLDSGIGKDIAHLLWREILSAISDQSGAGAILARAPEGERLLDLLERDYHTAAIRIAEHQDGRMAIWGAAFEKGETVYINSHLSLVEATRSNKIVFKVRRSSGFADQRGDIELTLPRTKFNFPLVISSRDALFRRPLMIDRTTNVRAAANRNAEKIGQFKKGDVAQGLDLRNGWFKVSLADNQTGYVIATNIKLAPLFALIDKKRINLRFEPVVSADSLALNSNIKGRFRILQQRFNGNRMWYQIIFNDRPLWIAASLTETEYSQPVVHFVAGLYRYFGGRNRDAIREFQRFIDFPGVEHSNVNLSVSYQYQALSSLFAGERTSVNQQYLRKASMQTPFDATPYKIEALSWIGERRGVEQIQETLIKINELEPDLEKFQNFEQTLHKVIGMPLGGS